MTTVTNLSVVKKLLQAAVERQVSEKLNSLIHGFEDYLKDMSKVEQKEAALIILRMMKITADGFFVKMEKRIQSKQV
jgi:hypothetical protein